MSNHGSWLSEPENQVEADLSAALEEARGRLPDEVTMRRLWSKVASPDVEQPVRSRWPWFVGGVITSSALAVAIGIWLVPIMPHTQFVIGSMPSQEPTKVMAPEIEPARTRPPAKASAQGEQEEAPELADPIAPTEAGRATGRTVRTTLGQTRRLVLRGGTVARVAPSSIMTVSRQGDGSERPGVEKGEVAFSVPHQAPGRNFSVAAGPYRIVVIGTKFRLHVEGINVAVAVDEGVVEVWRKHRVARLASGDSWASPLDRGTPVDGPATGPAEPQVASPVPAVVTPAAPAAATAPAMAPPPAAPPFDPMQEARAALAAGDPNRALDLYRAAVSRGGPAAENAEYEIGRVMRDRLRQPSEAIATWKRYRSSHPNGLLRVETDVSIIETLVASGDSGAALGEANDFLKHHAESERRAEIARISGDLYRERGDCGHAVGSYQTALAASRTREITEYASYQRAACLVSMGDASGDVAVEEYLHAWPRGRFSGDANRLLQGMNVRAKSP